MGPRDLSLPLAYRVFMVICPNCGEENPDKAKFCSECAAPLRAQAAPPQGARKTVTVVFCDLVGSTALGERLDSESLREVLDRYFTEMRTVLERHGGIVEKYIGDAIMAIFGLPRAHEDDALRAVRAASEMLVALESVNADLERDCSLSLANRTGVNTGEVVVGDPSSGQRLATGDAVNVAARLEQAAATNHVLIGQPTYRLVKDAVLIEAVEPLALKGKSERLPAFQLIEVRREVAGISRHLDAPLVGREEELARLLETFERVVEDRTCQLVTVLGEAGVGKSRLVGEVANRLRQHATVLAGRCLSYGEGITFWPLAEVIRHAAAITDEDSADVARHKIDDLIRAEEREIAERVASILGLSSASFPIDETFWAARRLLESLARQHPVVVILEDIHWAEPTFLDWVEHVVDLADAPILVVCAARPELREDRPGWSQRRANASLLDLQPLTGSESQVLIDNLLGASEATSKFGAHITAAAQGNPLFVEQIISMWVDDGTLHRDAGSWELKRDASASIPPTISALLAARLDRLGPDERTVIAGASVVGQVFYLGAVEELCSKVMKSKVPTSLSALEAKQFLRPDPSMFANEHAFAFRHVLIRDTAYEAMLKRTRADLHERVASWLERVTSERIAEYDEIVGYHLERAYVLLRELGPVDELAKSLAARGGARLLSAARRAFNRGDMPTSINLFERANSLLARDDPARLRLLPDFATALSETGELTRASAVLSQVIEIAEASGDHSLHWRATWVRFDGLIQEANEEAHDEAKRVIPLLTQLGDHLGLAKAWRLIADSRAWRCQAAASEEASWKGIDHARRAKDRREEVDIAAGLAHPAFFGPTPVDKAVERCEEVLRDVKGNLRAEAFTLLYFGGLKAMQGLLDAARTLISDGTAVLVESGVKRWGDLQAYMSGFVEKLADESEAAESTLRSAADLSENNYISRLALAHLLCSQDRYEEAREYVSSEPETGDLLANGILRPSALARMLVGAGEFRRAETLARQAVESAEQTDFSNVHADALMDLVAVLRLGGRAAQALPRLDQALFLYEQKGNIVSAAKARRLLEELNSPAPTTDR